MELTQREVLIRDELIEIGTELIQECLDQLTFEETLACIDIGRLINIIPPEERLAGLSPEQRMAGLSPEQRMAGLSLEERLAGIPTEDILEYLSRSGRRISEKS